MSTVHYHSIFLNLEKDAALILASFYNDSFARYAHLGADELHELARRQPALLKPTLTIGARLQSNIEQLSALTGAKVDAAHAWKAQDQLLEEDLLSRGYLQGPNGLPLSERGRVLSSSMGSITLADFLDLLACADIYPELKANARERSATATERAHSIWMLRQTYRDGARTVLPIAVVGLIALAATKTDWLNPISEAASGASLTSTSALVLVVSLAIAFIISISTSRAIDHRNDEVDHALARRHGKFQLAGDEGNAVFLKPRPRGHGKKEVN